MSYKAPDWEKDYLIENCEIAGYVQLTKLKADKYNKKNYTLSVLIDEKVGNQIQNDVESVLTKLGKKYKLKTKNYGRISDILSIKRDKQTREIIEEKPCPKGKLLLNLNTDSKDEEYLVYLYDAKNQLIEKETNIYAGSLINVKFKLSSFILGNEIGISTKLQGIQIIKANNPTATNELKESPFKAIENADDLEDEFVEDFGDDEEAEEL